MKYVTFLLVSVIVSIVTGVPDNSERVTNGVQAAAGDFPYIVSVTVGGGHICGGFIYNEYWIVTSAACVYNYLPSELRITLAQLSLIADDPEEKVLAIYRIVLFDGYDYTSGLHDIALLQTATPIEFSSNINFIPYDEARESPTEKGIFAGWGATYEGGLGTSRLRSIEVTFGSDCKAYGEDQYYPNYMLCAGGSAVDPGNPCSFDEGSPLVQEINGVRYAVGIMSKNKGCGATAEPTIYTRTMPYYPWFVKVAGDQPTPV
ncbi:trypsin-1-like isoform X1 [Daphnia carinata]|uniref:trypsin-1-like isoform X1 n=1 Tax=Daphnia carinata TaxID=120202 RepID=UPI00257D777F|nr:trypsin-1-like isoform X1 [Daphnia carinata]